jgi:zinc transport system ATP-binding protein
MTKILNVQDASVGYGSSILLKNLNFSISEQEILVIIGANGVGKSTLVKTILGLQKKIAGSISYSDAISFGYMPQIKPELAHLPMTVYEFLNIFKWDLDWKYEVLEKLKLISCLTQPLNHLSFGTWQRVNLAQAVSQQPRLLIVDEPTQGLDIDWQQNTYDFIAHYAEHKNAAVCCISHDSVAITKYADKVLCLDHQPSHVASLIQRSEAGLGKFVIYQHHHEEKKSCSH